MSSYKGNIPDRFHLLGQQTRMARQFNTWAEGKQPASPSIILNCKQQIVQNLMALAAFADKTSVNLPLCFVPRCHALLAEFQTFTYRIHKQRQLHIEDRKVCKILALQIGRLPVFPNEGDQFIMQCHQDASVFDLDLSLKALAIRGENTDAADYQAFTIWRRLHFAVSDCCCGQCGNIRAGAACG